jgi:GntR family transcriptional regulator, rspAB operon transcriptional repressor
MFVAGVDARDLASLSEARAVLEPAAARLAARRLTESDKAILDQLLAELDALGSTPDERDLINLDRRLHRFVYATARNPFLESTLDEQYTHALRIWFMALDRLPHLDDAVKEHRDILEAIRRGDADQAAITMAAHIDGFETSIRKAL